MKQTIILSLIALLGASCQQQSTVPTYNYQCTIYQVSLVNGDTTVYSSTNFINHPTPPQVMADSLNNSVNGGNHPHSFTKCQ